MFNRAPPRLGQYTDHLPRLDHLPGLADVPVLKLGGRPHPSYYFRKRSIAKGRPHGCPIDHFVCMLNKCLFNFHRNYIKLMFGCIQNASFWSWVDA